MEQQGNNIVDHGDIAEKFVHHFAVSRDHNYNDEFLRFKAKTKH